MTATSLSCDKNGNFDRSEIGTLKQIAVKLVTIELCRREDPLSSLLEMKRWVVKLLIPQLNEQSARRDANKLLADCSKAEPNIFAPSQTPVPGAQDGQNLISWR